MFIKGTIRLHYSTPSTGQESLGIGSTKEKPVTTMEVVKYLFKYVWPDVIFVYNRFSERHCHLLMMSFTFGQDNKEIKRRVVAAMTLLVSAKFLNAAVPFLFKFAVDSLNSHFDSPLHLNGDPQIVMLTSVTAILLGCELLVSIRL